MKIIGEKIKIIGERLKIIGEKSFIIKDFSLSLSAYVSPKGQSSFVGWCAKMKGEVKIENNRRKILYA